MILEMSRCSMAILTRYEGSNSQHCGKTYGLAPTLLTK